MKRTFLYPFCLAVLAAVLGVQAGFDHPRGRPDNQLTYDGVPVGTAGDPVAGETFNKLSAIYTNLTAAEITNKVAAFRTNILRAIEAIRAQDAGIADCLTMQFNQGRVCADVRNREANAAIISDRSTNCGAEPINIGINNLPCDPAPLYDRTMYQLLSSLAHEGRHALQDYERAATTNAADRVRARRSTACNEIEAENTENAMIDNLKPALSNLVAGVAVPNSTTGAALRVAQALTNDMTLTEPQRRAAASNLLVTVCNIRRGNLVHIECRVAQKEAFDRFLTNNITQDEMNRRIRATRWYAVYGRTNGDFGPVSDPIYFGAANSPLFHQASGDREEVITTPLDAVTDMHLSEDGRRLLLAGDLLDTGDGAVLGYEDLDGDGFFEPETQRQLLLSNDLFGGVDLEFHVASGQWLALNLEDNEVHRLFDTGSDGFPDIIVPAGGFDPSRQDLLALIVSEDGSLIFGLNEALMGNELVVTPDTLAAVAASEPSGEFLPQEDRRILVDCLYVPVLLTPPAPSSPFLLADAPPFAMLDVLSVEPDGTPIETVGAGNADFEGQAFVELFRPLTPGELLLLVDPLGERQSVIYPVGADTDPPTLQFDVPDQFIFTFEGGPVLFFEVTRTGDTNGTVTVDYFTSDGDATAGSDYEETSGTLTFLPGETNQPVAVVILDDDEVEPEESFELVLANPTGAELGFFGSVVIGIEDDDVVAGQVDLVIATSVSGECIPVGQPAILSTSVTHLGLDPASNIVVQHFLPADVTIVAANAPPGTTYDEPSRQWFIFELPPGGVSTLMLAAVKETPGVADYQAELISVDPPDSNPANDFASATAVWVIDGDGPLITCPPDMTIPARGTNGAHAFFSVGALDNCDPDVTLICDPPSGSLFPLGASAVTCTAIDASGNTSICTFTVAVEPAPLMFLNITVQGPDVVLEWIGGAPPYTLLRKATLSDSAWEAVVTTYNSRLVLARGGASAFYRLAMNEIPLETTDYDRDRPSTAQFYNSDPKTYWVQHGIPALARLADAQVLDGEPATAFEGMHAGFTENLFLRALSEGQLPPDFAQAVSNAMTMGESPWQALTSTLRGFVRELDQVRRGQGDSHPRIGEILEVIGTVFGHAFSLSRLEVLAPHAGKEFRTAPPAAIPAMLDLHGSDAFCLTLTTPPGPDDNDTNTVTRWTNINSVIWNTTYNAACVAQAVGPSAAKLGILPNEMTCKDWNDLSEALGAEAGKPGLSDHGGIARWYASKGYSCTRAWNGFLGLSSESAAQEAKKALDRGCDVQIWYCSASQCHEEMVTKIEVDPNNKYNATITTLSWGQAATVDFANGNFSNKSDGRRYRQATEPKSWLEGSGTAQLFYYCKN